MNKLRIDILTIFPKLFDNFLQEALISRAIKKKLVDIRVHDLRKWTKDAHKTVDSRPFGGGEGMVMMVEPIMRAINSLLKNKAMANRTRIIVLSAKGTTFKQSKARALANLNRIILICGRYEGIDERVHKFIAHEEISIGDFVLFGGEVPAMAVTEAITRLIPGAVGKINSVLNESFKELSDNDKQIYEKFLEHPQYARPEKILINGKNRVVPKILLSGNHKKISEWRESQSRKVSKLKPHD